jgi:hypothetical protein
MCFCLRGKALSSCAVHQLILFTSTHLCKTRFSNYSPRKTKYRNGLNMAPDLRSNFYNIKPNIKACEEKKKNHSLHLKLQLCGILASFFLISHPCLNWFVIYTYFWSSILVLYVWGGVHKNVSNAKGFHSQIKLGNAVVTCYSKYKYSIWNIQEMKC